MIHGVHISHLQRHDDERQTLVEVFKSSSIRQVTMCVMHKGVTKLRHFHRNQTDTWHVAEGQLRVCLCDLRSESPTFGKSYVFTLYGDKPQVVTIPPLVAHGCEVISGPCRLIYAADQFYNPSDEYRIP
jgi:dTDP-4-dehydrorhamnose 3,5-epimerase